MTVLAFTGSGARDDDNEFGETARLVNCYLEPGERTYIKPVLGTTAFADLSDVFLRAMRSINGVIYAACGGNLYSISSGGTATVLGAISDGETTISSNNGKVTVAANGTYYVWDGTTLSTPDTGAFSNVGSVTYAGQFTIVTENEGKRFNWSSIADPETFSGLDFSSAESRDDNILRAMWINGALVIFGEQSRETWYQTGSSDSTLAFSRVAGAVSDTGLKARALIAEVDNGAVFVGDDQIVYLTDGQSQQPISNRAVETSIKQSDPLRCFFYEDEGHKFVTVTFSDRPAWVYDIATGFWHERLLGTGQTWPIVESVKLGSDWYVGDDLGAISKLEAVAFDGTEPLRKRAVSKTLFNDGQRFRLAELEMFANAGRGDTSCWLRFSKDNGNTWGEEKHRELGAVGQYEKRATWRSQGLFRRLTAELNWSDNQTFANEANVRLA